MSTNIVINKKRYPVTQDRIPDDVLEVMKQKADKTELSLEKLVQQSLLNHWVQNDRFRKSDPETIGVLLRLAYEFGYDQLKLANAKFRVLSINEERREAGNAIFSD